MKSSTSEVASFGVVGFYGMWSASTSQKQDDDDLAARQQQRAKVWGIERSWKAERLGGVGE